jgi:hypothetical protein
VLSNLNLKTSFGPLPVLVHTVSGKLQVGQLGAPPVVVVEVEVVALEEGSSLFFFLHEANKEMMMPASISFLILILFLPNI